VISPVARDAAVAQVCEKEEDTQMIRKTVYTALTCVALSTHAAFACSAEDVQSRQGALLEAVQTLLAVNPAKAQDIVVQMQTELDAANEAGDEAAVCAMMDRLTEEAHVASGS